MSFARRDSEDSRPDTISPLSTSNSLADHSLPMHSPAEFPLAHKEAQQIPFKFCSDQELEAGRRLWSLFEQRFEARLEQIEKQNLLLQRHYTELFASIYKLEQVVGSILTKHSQPLPKRMRMEEDCPAQNQEEPGPNSCPPQLAMKPLMELLVQFIKNNNNNNNNSNCEEARKNQLFTVSELTKNKETETTKSAQQLSTPVHLVQVSL
ncbi:hypothetical protein Ciccas_009226 [Cichlidogyrus casuarinus]|uniref:Uncharacterized protein n=1 Tax=Cichlidogyrus casuarinus TaxID=1844966 RepID=A0ABD2PZ36_9PLAT